MIYFVYADRAEKSILAPVIKIAKERKKNFREVDLSSVIDDLHLDQNLSKIYDYTFSQIEEDNVDYAVVIGDRREIMFACLAFFVKGVKIHQLAAGDLSEKITLVDDYFRHLITIMSSKQVCFSDKSKSNSDTIMKSLGLDTDSTMIPNPTLSDIDIDSEDSLMSEEYDLVLVHPQSLSRSATQKDRDEIISLLNPERKTVIIKGNRDLNYDVLYDLWKDLSSSENVEVFQNLEKEPFINLLRNCERFITNSSCSFYEAPLFLEDNQIIRVGNRNRGREVVKYELSDLKSSDTIFDFLEKNLKNEQYSSSSSPPR